MDSRLRCGRRRTLIELAMDLTLAAGELAEIAEAEVEPYAGPPLPDQIAALIEARSARATLFHLDLVEPKWTLLLELYRAHLERRPLRWQDVAEQWDLARLREAGLATHDGPIATLTDFGAETMAKQFKAEMLALRLL